MSASCPICGTPRRWSLEWWCDQMFAAALIGIGFILGMLLGQ